MFFARSRSIQQSFIRNLFRGTDRRRRPLQKTFRSETMEPRTLLTQIITATVDNLTPAVGDTIEIAVNYNFTGADRVQSQGVNVQMHFNSAELQFTGFKSGTFELDGKVEPSDITNPVLADDTAAGENKDGNATTDKFVKSVWNVALGNWPGVVDPATGNRNPSALPGELFVATFEVKAGFDGETVNFTGTPQGGEVFVPASVTIDVAGGPTQVVTPTANVSSIGTGETFEVSVPYSIEEIARLQSQGLNVQMHFNNSELEFVGFKTGTFELDGKVEPSDITSPVLNDDAAAGENKDGDANTDTFVKSVWNVALGNWPATTDPATGNRTPKSLPGVLYVAVFKTRDSFDGETIRFTGTPQGGARFRAQPVTVDLGGDPSFDFDIDGSGGDLSSSRDALLVYLWMLDKEFGGGSVPDGNFLRAIDQTTATRKTRDSVVQYLDSSGTLLDIDGSGGALSSSRDALLAYLWMLDKEFGGGSVPDGNFLRAIDQATATRKTRNSVVQYLDGLQNIPVVAADQPAPIVDAARISPASQAELDDLFASTDEEDSLF